MESSSGISSNSSVLHEDPRLIMDQRKRKRMLSNRESARRSRLRKQNHLDTLTAQVAELRKQNHEILTALEVTRQHGFNAEFENCVLRAQAAELSHRLQSLNEMIGLLGDGYDGFPANGMGGFAPDDVNGFAGSWNCVSQPIVMMAASADTGILY